MENKSDHPTAPPELCESELPTVIQVISTLIEIGNHFAVKSVGGSGEIPMRQAKRFYLAARCAERLLAEHRGCKTESEPICDCGTCNTCLHPWNNYPTTYGESK
jgi:hypothetical protein